MSLFNEIITNTESDKPAFRQAPEGDYLVTVRAAKKVQARSGTEGIELQFTLQDAMDPSADMEGVDLARCRLRDSVWVTENSIDIARRTLARINDETVGKTFTDSLDVLPGSEVVVRVKHVTHDREGKELRTPFLEVDRYYTKAWYFDNKLAA